MPTSAQQVQRAIALLKNTAGHHLHLWHELQAAREELRAASDRLKSAIARMKVAQQRWDSIEK